MKLETDLILCGDDGENVTPLDGPSLASTNVVFNTTYFHWIDYQSD